MSETRTVVCDSCGLTIPKGEERFALDIDHVNHAAKRRPKKTPGGARLRARLRRHDFVGLDLCATCAGSGLFTLATLMRAAKKSGGDS